MSDAAARRLAATPLSQQADTVPVDDPIESIGETMTVPEPPETLQESLDKLAPILGKMMADERTNSILVLATVRHSF